MAAFKVKREGTSYLTIEAFMGGNMDTWCDRSAPRSSFAFGRCYRLLEDHPEWRERIQEMAAVSPQWAILVESWPKFAELYRWHEYGQLNASIQAALQPHSPAEQWLNAKCRLSAAELAAVEKLRYSQKYTDSDLNAELAVIEKVQRYSQKYTASDLDAIRSLQGRADDPTAPVDVATGQPQDGKIHRGCRMRYWDAEKTVRLRTSNLHEDTITPLEDPFEDMPGLTNVSDLDSDSDFDDMPELTNVSDLDSDSDFDDMPELEDMPTNVSDREPADIVYEHACKDTLIEIPSDEMKLLRLIASRSAPNVWLFLVLLFTLLNTYLLVTAQLYQLK
jgi:hypothetical protein